MHSRRGPWVTWSGSSTSVRSSALLLRPTWTTSSEAMSQVSNVDLGSGEVGVGATMRIRGAGSLVLSSNPLVYIDGVRVNNEAGDQYGSSVGVDGTGAPTRLNDIDPEMIESIEVIKGPAAATLYGTEASNGVIQIITKKGVEGEPQFTLTSKVGQSWYPDPRKHWPSAYFTCQGIGDGSCTPGEIVGVNVFQEDWERHGMNHFRVGMPYGLSGAVSGGGNGLRYHFSLGWDHDEGAVPYNWKNQLNGRGNLDWAPRDDLTVSLGLGLVRSEFSSASAEQPITVAFHWACPGAGCEEGSGQPNALDGPFRGYIAYLPEVYEENVRGGQDVIRNTYNLTTNHQPFDWLDHRLIVGFDLTETRNHHLLKHLQGGVGASPRQGMREVEYQTTEYVSLDYGATANWEPISGLELATSTGVQYYDKTVESVQSEGENFPVPTLESISAGAERSTSDFFIQNKTFGVYVQEQFSWENRLFVTVAGRGDDNSAFGRDFDFVVYPKLSASWVVSEEAMLSDVDWLTSLRLRGAWGEAGQQPDIFAAARLYEPVTSFQGQPGVTPATVGNEAVEPEVGEEIELGFDAGLFDDRLAVEFTRYNQNRRNALINVPVRPSTGFPGTQFRNLGEIRNTGYEIGLEWDAYRGQDVNVHLGTSLHLNDNEITDMGGIGPLPLTASNPSTGWSRQRFAEGFPVGAIFGPRVVSADIVGDGLDARAVNVMCESGPIAVPGTNLTRGGGDPVPCDSEDAPEVFWGQPIPTREVGFTATVTLFNDLRLYAQLDYEGGHHLIDGHVAAAHTFFRNTREIEERDDPILLGYEALADLGTNQPGLFDASFARLRTVSASYTLPEGLAASIGASTATLSVSGQNLWMPWRAQEEGFGRKIVDPELRYTGASGTDPGG
ncbi:MAG: TonB-dependent receptor [Gemmatimonadota bacterium]|nr:TonB-dependent receptor [Gemmatimonadota bacterium]